MSYIYLGVEFLTRLPLDEGIESIATSLVIMTVSSHVHEGLNLALLGSFMVTLTNYANVSRLPIYTKRLAYPGLNNATMIILHGHLC